MGDYVVELYENAAGRQVVAREVSKILSPRQDAIVTRQLMRLEAHGRMVGRGWFGRVRGSARGLEELRLTADRMEVRFLFSFEPPNMFLLLTCYKEQSGGIPDGKIATAEARLDEWRSRQQ